MRGFLRRLKAKHWDVTWTEGYQDQFLFFPPMPVEPPLRRGVRRLVRWIQDKPYEAATLLIGAISAFVGIIALLR